MTPQIAYRCTDPATVEAYRQWRFEYDAHRQRVIAEAEQIGKNTGALIAKSVFGERIVGLAPDDPADPPKGWRYKRSLDKLYPDRRSKAGKEADAWLERAQPPSHLTWLHEHGMADSTRAAGRMYTPGIHLADGELLVAWDCEPPAEQVTGPWERIPLSRYYAAIEKEEAAA